jgi:hypothetical protein
MSGITLILALLFSVLAALGLGTVGGLFLRRTLTGRRMEEAEGRAATIVSEAEQRQKAVMDQFREAR